MKQYLMLRAVLVIFSSVMMASEKQLSLEQEEEYVKKIAVQCFTDTQTKERVKTWIKAGKIQALLELGYFGVRLEPTKQREYAHTIIRSLIAHIPVLPSTKDLDIANTSASTLAAFPLYYQLLGKYRTCKDLKLLSDDYYEREDIQEEIKAAARVIILAENPWLVYQQCASSSEEDVTSHNVKTLHRSSDDNSEVWVSKDGKPIITRKQFESEKIALQQTEFEMMRAMLDEEHQKCTERLFNNQAAEL